EDRRKVGAYLRDESGHGHIGVVGRSAQQLGIDVVPVVFLEHPRGQGTPLTVVEEHLTSIDPSTLHGLGQGFGGPVVAPGEQEGPGGSGRPWSTAEEVVVSMAKGCLWHNGVRPRGG